MTCTETLSEPHRTPDLVQPETPCLIIDLEEVRATYAQMVECLPSADIYYAVKANPSREIIETLANLGCRFDVASPVEVRLCLAAGVCPEDLSYGNTIKKSADIAYAYAQGVRLFAFDCEPELDKLARNAPGSRVFCRLATTSQGSGWPLARKFGCDAAMAEALLAGCTERGLVPWGVSFHVGSQQSDPAQWIEPIARTGELFRRLAHRGVDLRMVNIGGGFPARYNAEVFELSRYSDCIQEALDRHLSHFHPHVMVEPGRGLVGNAGTILTRVVLVSRREPRGPRWIYLDIGKFGGLAETMDECIQYRIRFSSSTAPDEPAVLAGPTCDSADILYERNLYRMPLDLAEGDCLEILSTGAYTSSYASVGFNGFGPLPVYFVDA